MTRPGRYWDCWQRFSRGPARIGYLLGLASSTVYACSAGCGFNRLDWLDRPTGRWSAATSTTPPGALVHTDIGRALMPRLAADASDFVEIDRVKGRSAYYPLTFVLSAAP